MLSCTPPVLQEQLGDYGYFGNSGFHCEGNIFDHCNSCSSDADISPKQHRIDEQRGYNTDGGPVRVGQQGLSGLSGGIQVTLYKPIGLSVPSNDLVNSILAFPSARFTNRYLVTRIIQCDQVTKHQGLFSEPTYTEVFHIMCLIVELGPIFNVGIPLCTFAKPFVWHRDHENASSASESWATS